MLVLDKLPVAVALPVVMLALPVDELLADPVLLFTPDPPPPPPADCVPVAEFVEPFPVALLPPELATAVPPFDTVALWLMIWMLPLCPLTVVFWEAPGDDLFPVADASPDLVLALPPDELLGCGAAAVVEVPPVFELLLVLSAAAAGRAPAKSIKSITAPPNSSP
jgi:hypothetical protein